MRKSVVTIVITLIAALILPTTSSAAPKAGAKCPKKGKIHVYKNYEYKCVKKSGKLVWSKGNKISQSPTELPEVSPSPEPLPSSTPTPQPKSTNANYDPLKNGFRNPCEPDPEVPEEWRSVQNWAIKYAECARPYRYVPGPINLETPNSKISDSNELASIQTCQVFDPKPPIYRRAIFGPYRYPFLWEPTKSAVFQIIGIEYADYSLNSKPKEDYRKYLDFIRDTLINISDVPIKPEFRGGEKYYRVAKSLKDYKLNEGHNSPGKIELTNEVLALADKEVDFREVDFVIFVGPPNSPLAYNGGYLGEGLRYLDGNRIEYAYFVGAIEEQPRTGSEWTVDPSIMIHELLYHEFGLDDHGGADIKGMKANSVTNLSDLGTGDWGHMSGAYGDLLLWDKWLVGLIYDSQIRCAPKEKKTIHWLKPSSIKGNFVKGLVIPIDSSRAIVVESMRSYGYFFKMPRSTNGALVYTVDTTETRFGYGIEVKKPTNRNTPNATLFPKGNLQERISEYLIFGDATLKLNESVVIEDVKITVIESGEFGDVVKVERNQ